jgi:DNA-directed RNA polymerase subunit RPC12/RpoP
MPLIRSSSNPTHRTPAPALTRMIPSSSSRSHDPMGRSQAAPGCSDRGTRVTRGSLGWAGGATFANGVPALENCEQTWKDGRIERCGRFSHRNDRGRKAMDETPSQFIAVCPNCLISLRVKYAWSGRHVCCKHCNHKFQALAPDFPPAPSHDESAPAVLMVNSISSEVDRMSVVCPSCSVSLRVQSIYAGRYVRCGQCEKKFLFPSVVQAQRQANLSSSFADFEVVRERPGG